MQKLKDKWQLIAVIVLSLVDMCGIYPVYESAMADPMANLPPAPMVPPAIQLDDDQKAVAGGNKVPRPPAVLYTWEPFYRPSFGKIVVVEEQPEIDISTQSTPTEAIQLLGIIRLNGEYRALVSIEGEPAMEIRKGQAINATDGIVVVDIRRNAVIVAKEGYRNGIVQMEMPSLEAHEWYQRVDDEPVRGKLEFIK